MAYIVDYLTENSTYDFEYIKLDNKLAEKDGQAAKYFLADYRDYYAYADNPHFCVHEGTTSPPTLLRKMGWAHQHRTPTKVFVFEARNRSQCELWLRERGWQTSGQPRQTQTSRSRTQERIMINSTEREIQMLERVAYEAQERAMFLRTLPSQPKRVRVVEGEKQPKAGVIFFERTFGGTRVYTYAAVKASDGLWYTTGPRTPKGYRWRELIAWINGDGPVDVYKATAFELLGNSIFASAINAAAISMSTLSDSPE